MRLHFLGVRGSTPAPGTNFVRYGGNTSCIAVAHHGDRPSLLLDAGTGARRLVHPLDGAAFRGAVLLTHLHWDHTHGIPFSRSLDHPDAEVELFVPAQAVDTATAAIERSMAPPSFPISPSQLRGRWTISALEPGQHQVAGFSVTAAEVPHKGGRTFGYRVVDNTAAIAYLPDHGPIALGPGPDGLGERHPAALALASDVEALVHDAQYTTEEFGARAGFGHSAIDYAIDLGVRARAQRVVLFHHDPDRTDHELDRIAACHANRRNPEVVVASEDLVLDL